VIDFSCQDKTDELCGEARNSIANARFAIVGVGALGCAAAHALIRSGALHLLLIDDDLISASNIPRQSLFVASDIGKKKVLAAKKHLLAINKDAKITTSVQRITEETVHLLRGQTLILDCSDNMETRMIIDNFSLLENISWVHAAVVRSVGEVMAFTKKSKRFQAFMQNKRAEADCSSDGVLSVAAMMTGSFQAVVALRLLIGKEHELIDKLFRLDCWQGKIDSFTVS
jgi:molybdopterin/thiamine biosynthesis adenylyltransferase